MQLEKDTASAFRSREEDLKVYGQCNVNKRPSVIWGSRAGRRTTEEKHSVKPCWDSKVSQKKVTAK